MMYEYDAEVIRVIDGDTIEVLFDLGLGVFKKAKIRFARIDTPETYGVKKESAEYIAGKKATAFVIEWLERHDNKIRVVTVKDKKGGFGRYLGEIYTREDSEPVNLNDLLLSEGLAELYV